MKIIQIMNGLCHWDATSQFPTMKSLEGRFAPNIVFAEAPDYVFEGWGYDESADGDARFIKPTPPDGWLYDDATGTFYERGGKPSTGDPVQDELRDLREENTRLNAIITLQAEQQTALEDCLLEMADIVYA